MKIIISGSPHKMLIQVGLSSVCCSVCQIEMRVETMPSQHNLVWLLSSPIVNAQASVLYKFLNSSGMLMFSKRVLQKFSL